MKNSKKKRLLYEQGMRHYANKKPVRLYPAFIEFTGKSKRDKDGRQLGRTLRHLWRGNAHVRAKV